jgi:Fe-S cluster assembly protein SufD
MTAVAAETDLYRSLHADFEAEATRVGWLDQARRRALERFLARGFPTTRDEAFRSTSLAPLSRTVFHRPRRNPEPAWTERLRQLDFGGAFSGWEIVFVDGRYSPELSSAVPTGDVTIRSLSEALRAEPERLEPHLGRQTEEAAGQVAADLNTAFLEDGALVEVAPGVHPNAPIHLVYLSTGTADRPTLSHPRTLVLAGPGSQTTVVQTFGGQEGGLYLSNPVTEVVVGDGAGVDHYVLERESDRAFHLGALLVRQGRQSRFADHSVLVGGALVRHDVGVRLLGEGGGCTLNGLIMGDGLQHLDAHTVIDHVAPRGQSRELYKGILRGRARGVFHGRIRVRPGAQQTDAHQVNRNLLLSPEALVDSTPQLEILADDVRCRHGSTTGQLDQAALFYLRARGIGEEDARGLLTYAFASDVVNRIKVQPIRVSLESFLNRRLPVPAPEAA